MSITNFDRQYFHNVLTHYESIKKLWEGKISSPRFCTLQTSNRCNQNCRGCSFGYHDIQLNNKIMSWSEHKKVLQDLIDIGVRGFEFCGGGEPTCLPYLLDAMKFLHDNNCSFGMITNGVFLTPKLIDYVLLHGTYIRVSLESAQEGEYRRYKRCPKDHFSKVVDNIHDLVTRKQHGSTCDVGVKFDVSKSLKGFNHFSTAIEFGEIRKVDSIQFKCLRHYPEELSYSEKVEQNDILQRLKEGCNVPIIDWLIPIPFDLIPQCVLSPLHIVVDYVGDVYICCYYYYRAEEHRLGNLFAQPLRDLWFSKKHQEKVKNIQREKCTQVDCKFFEHHRIINEAFRNGRIEFL